MASKTVEELRAKTDAASKRLHAQLEGMEPYADRADAPGEWTTRQVLSHLLFEPGFDPVAVLRRFSVRDYPQLDIQPSEPHVDDARRRMSVAELARTLDAQRRAVFGYVDGLSDEEVQTRKLRIPLFKEFMGTDEIPIATYVGAMFDYHWGDHAGQLAKIRKAVGLPEATA